MTPFNPKIALIIPTLNGSQHIKILFENIIHQTLQPDSILVIDSSSTDDTRELLKSFPVKIHTIPQSQFDHGGTRKLATQLVDADIYLFLTQDAYPATPNTFKALIDLLTSDDKIACAYGRQLAKDNANILSEHARIFNYPAVDQIRTFSDKDTYGIKTCFNSNSFAAYKKTPLLQAGNFPDKLILGEDVFIAAKLLQLNYAIAYSAKATVFHSHNFTIAEEFHRYFSIGVFHGRERFILDDFKSATNEGIKFVKSEMKFLIKQKKLHFIPRALLSTLIKYAAYRLGLNEKKIPYNLKKNLGLNKSFWLKENA